MTIVISGIISEGVESIYIAVSIQSCRGALESPQMRLSLSFDAKVGQTHKGALQANTCICVCHTFLPGQSTPVTEIEPE
jgi:hypothetical protein